MDLKLVHEISHVSSYLASRPDATNASSVELANKLARSMTQQVQHMPFIDASAASRLSDAVKTSGYTQAGKTMIGDAIDAQMTKSMGDTPRTATTPKPCSQRLHEHMPRYLTMAETTKLQCTKTSYDTKQQVVIDRLKLIGLNHTDELTMAFAVALLTIHHDDKLPSYKNVFSRYNDFKVAFKCCTRIWPFGFISVYPSSPSELPDEMRKHAYADEQPSGYDVHRLKFVATKQVPMRSNSKLLRQPSSGKKKKKRSSSSSSHAHARDKKKKTSKRKRAKSEASDSAESAFTAAKLQPKPSPMIQPKVEPTVKVEPVRGMPQSAINSEPPSIFEPVIPKAELVAEPTTETEVVPMPSLSELSDSEKAMMDSLTRRDTDTKEKKKKAKAELTKVVDELKGDCDVMKKPGSAVMKKPGSPGSAVMKRPGSATPSKASSAVKRPSCFAGSPKPKMPTSHSSVAYKGGRIYTQWAKKKFRAIKDTLIPSKEKHLKWKSATPTKLEWNSCIESVDEYWSKAA
jgi:hypothetical protein